MMMTNILLSLKNPNQHFRKKCKYYCIFWHIHKPDWKICSLQQMRLEKIFSINFQNSKFTTTAIDIKHTHTYTNKYCIRIPYLPVHYRK